MTLSARRTPPSEREFLEPDGLVGVTLAPRLLAGLIDLGLVLALTAGLMIARSAVASDLFYYLCSLAAIGMLIFYFAIPEFLWQTTPGKLVFALEVVTADGARPGLHQTIIRALTRMPEACMLLPYIVLIKNNPRHQRLGDVMSETYVVRRQPHVAV